ncbi:hypothetical protein NSIN_40204 [Nitrosotalea sinensis]|uniref:Uncharacterized protein n=1 Tax=Nitrosotalea sinensis TaxID=1499975 RepID=A0A2H1EJ45_9ARCH|nr:hypothetical protein NSIN_40204 [Candidatus Nitrosotalea sinensis]
MNLDAREMAFFGIPAASAEYIATAPSIMIATMTKFGDILFVILFQLVFIVLKRLRNHLQIHVLFWNFFEKIISRKDFKKFGKNIDLKNYLMCDCTPDLNIFLETNKVL